MLIDEEGSSDTAAVGEASTVTSRPTIHNLFTNAALIFELMRQQPRRGATIHKEQWRPPWRR
ncbi:hypothetical protein GGD83_004845 [Rhodoblastus sphagnicola]|nr:hypothetical protein [Rhodoblastus sphagnicola]